MEKDTYTAPLSGAGKLSPGRPGLGALSGGKEGASGLERPPEKRTSSRGLAESGGTGGKALE